MESIDWALLIKALGLVFILEGVALFFAPAGYRTVMRQLAQWGDGHLRIAGFCGVALGWLLLLVSSG